MEKTEVFKRPRLDDPAEFDIIRSIYLFNNTPTNNGIDDIDSEERLDRMLHTHKPINQAR